ncbi:DUF3219 family protein [Tenuibacillus multivorans]|uniref:DUF3219 domain-containing protein n=1 Tax=Tenuibacillus multivorans TaxID=237069 RepID=A0A1H0EG91_9BACI|nr:DUF3219 family protein [Tenuibacillus multivorans]GEL77172.1 hypothetical protein TMU01_14070 [Tenuibacillus multivorans]SDN81358.1 Protein of unknown function [Tenuibacillus multivorans]
MTDVFINNYLIKAVNFSLEKEQTKGKDLNVIVIDFKVHHDDYHDVTTLLYINDFEVKVPSEDLFFRAEIQNYFTSFTNLYKEGAVGDYHLELIEKKEE